MCSSSLLSEDKWCGWPRFKFKLLMKHENKLCSAQSKTLVARRSRFAGLKLALHKQKEVKRVFLLPWMKAAASRAALLIHDDCYLIETVVI